MSSINFSMQNRNCIGRSIKVNIFRKNIVNNAGIKLSKMLQWISGVQHLYRIIKISL